MDIFRDLDDPFIVGKNYPVNFADLVCSSKPTNKIVVGVELVARQYVLDLVRCNL